ncbi:jg7288, partial [Pararge aegeria aegeria]
INELAQKCQVKLLWIAPDLHSHPRYACGAFTSNEATSFVQAATQIKRCLEVSQRLNAECFLLWPYREGYDAIFQTDVAREIKLFAKLLKITAEYKDRINYRCQLLIMPYHGSFGRNYSSFGSSSWQPSCREDMLNRYMWDMTSCLYFLKHHSLERFYKVCTPPGHHMYMANV